MVVEGTPANTPEAERLSQAIGAQEFKARLEKATGGIPVAVTKGEQPTALVGALTAAP
ncbi:hypothetical protein [Streptomyces sp. NPDC003952]